MSKDAVEYIPVKLQEETATVPLAVAKVEEDDGDRRCRRNLVFVVMVVAFHVVFGAAELYYHHQKYHHHHLTQSSSSSESRRDRKHHDYQRDHHGDRHQDRGNNDGGFDHDGHHHHDGDFHHHDGDFHHHGHHKGGGDGLEPNAVFAHGEQEMPHGLLEHGGDKKGPCPKHHEKKKLSTSDSSDMDFALWDGGEDKEEEELDAKYSPRFDPTVHYGEESGDEQQPHEDESHNSEDNEEGEKLAMAMGDAIAEERLEEFDGSN